MNYNNLYNFKNPVKHFLNIDGLAFPTEIDTFDTGSLCWTVPISFRVKKEKDKARVLKMPNILSFVRAYHYYKVLPNFEDIQSMDYLHKRMSANIVTGDFVAGEYDRQLEGDFEKLCIYDHMMKLDIKEYYGRIYTHNLNLNGLKDNVLSGINYGGTNGLLMGNYLSLYFAESMLNNISESVKDNLLGENVECEYMYFSDDFYFFCNKYDDEKIVKIFDKALEKYGLERNESKKEIYTYETYNSNNLLVRYWKKIMKYNNIEILKDYEKENKNEEWGIDKKILHKLAFLNQLIYRMSNINDEKLQKIFINNFFKTKYFRELELNDYKIRDYDYHQLCFLLKFSPESLLYSTDKFSDMNSFSKDKVNNFFNVCYSRTLTEIFNDEQLYYYYALKQFSYEDIIKSKEGFVAKSDNQILISYYLKDGYFSDDSLSYLKEKTDEEYWFQNYHLILYCDELFMDLENSIKKYLIPKKANKDKNKEMYMNFYKDNLNAKNDMINSILGVKQKIKEYLDLRFEETEFDFNE